MKEFFKYLTKEFRFVLVIIFFIAIVVINVYLKFTNPDMTETRLFMSYWPFYIIEVACILFLVVLNIRKK
jgi:hypothetical protein